MAFYIKIMRYIGRSNTTSILVFITLFITFAAFHLYQKGKISSETDGSTQPVAGEKVVLAVPSTSKNEPPVNQGTPFFLELCTILMILLSQVTFWQTP